MDEDKTETTDQAAPPPTEPDTTGQEPPPPVGPLSWIWAILPLIIAVALAAMVIGLAIGWAIHSPPAQMPSKLMTFDPCGQKPEDKALRNRAWKMMADDERSDGSPEAVVGIILQAMVHDKAPADLRIDVLKKYWLKSSFTMDDSAREQWLKDYLGPRDGRLKAIGTLIDADARMATLAKCLLQDKERMAKVAAGQKVPLEK